MNGQYTIATYHEYIKEGIVSLKLAHIYQRQAEINDKAGKSSRNLQLSVALHSRYSFLMFANSIEAAANAFLRDLYLADESYENLEKLGTLAKIFLYCDLNDTPADKGNHLCNHVKEIINCRNEFVHPKPTEVDVDLSNGKAVLLTKKTKVKSYPMYFREISFSLALEALKDVLSFLAWITFDICKHSLEDGVFTIGYDIFDGNTKVIESLQKDLNIKFDLRTFGKE